MRAALAILAAACASPPPTAKPAVELELPRECRAANLRGALLDCIGAVRDRLYIERKLQYRDRELVAYVSGVARRVAAAAGGVKLAGIRVLDYGELGAQAGLGGFIYITRGSLAALDSEAELAALLGHELGHIASGHSQDAITAIGTVDLGRGTDEEQMADELAVKYLAAAGYDPNAVLTMLQAIIGSGTEPTSRRYPAPLIRQAHVARLAAGRTGELGRERYLEAINGLVVGRDRRNGMVNAGKYVNTRAGLLLAPGSEWALEDDAEVCTGKGPRDLQFLLVTAGDLSVAAVLDGETTERRLPRGLAVREGWMSSDPSEPPIWVAAVRGSESWLLLFVTGQRRAVLARTGRSLVDRLEPTTAGVAKELAPGRIAITRVRKRGSLSRVVRRHCDDYPATLAIERGGPKARRSRNDLLKCVQATDR